MEFLDSSPNYMRATSSFYAKKDFSQVGSECDGIVSSASSSTKKPKSFKNIKSFRRRAKSRTTASDEGSVSSPSYLKSTRSSELGRRALLRSPSSRNVGILMKKASFKPRRGSPSYSKASDDVDVVTRATHSSTLKGSKFLEPEETEETSPAAAKICRYHHCSLHGHCRGDHDSVSQTKRFLYNRRRLLRRQKSLVIKTQLEKRSGDKRKDSRFGESELVSVAEQVGRDGSGETAFPLGQHRHCPTCTCSGFDDMAKKPTEQVVCYVEDTVTSSRANEKANKEDGEETPVIHGESIENNIAFSSSSNSGTPSDLNSEGEGDSKTESTPDADSEMNSPTQEVENLRFSKPRHISMWNLIHERMTSNLTAVEGESPVDGDNSFLARGSANSGNDSENREIERRKMFAVKLVKEAIEKILLAEVQDQSSDDQSSVSSDSTPREEIEENRAESNAADEDEGKELAQPKQEGPIVDKTTGPEIKKIGKWFVKKSENKAPKHWSNLKKWILLQRFIRELEKVKKFNPKRPQLLPLNPDPEAENVSLRPLASDRRKNSEEWMLDYALRQAVDQLAPTQKRKVALLVRAFETVAPIKEDEAPQAQNRIPRLISDESAFPANQELGLKETEKPLPVRGDYGESSSSPVEAKIEESGQTNPIKMWHMIYQHVASGIAEKVGSQLLDGSEDDEAEDNISPKKKSHGSSGFTKLDALKLVKEAVDEILLPETQEESPDTQKGERPEVPKAKNWSKVKRLMLVKNSIRALEKARTAKPQEPEVVPQATEKTDLKREMMDEKKKAEQWMLDYAVQHIVTKLTPDRKRRVCMLVEAFEAVVPLPGM